MSHECPECGQVCYCGGDIDDCLNNFEQDVINCAHCLDEDDLHYSEYEDCDCYDCAAERIV